jgi:hypothetical protein
MKRFLFLIGAVFLASDVLHAQTALFDACKALLDANKRAECFEELAKRSVAVEPSPVDLTSEISRSVMAIQSARGSNLTRAVLADLVRRANLSVDEYLAKNPAISAVTRNRFETMKTSYADSLRLIEQWDAFYSRRGNAQSYGFGVPYEMAGMGWVPQRYTFNIGKADLLGFHRGFQLGDALSAMLDQAKSSVDIALEEIAQGSNVNPTRPKPE